MFSAFRICLGDSVRFALLAATALTTTIAFLVPGAGYAQSTHDWSGPYVGVNLGVVYSESPVTVDDNDTPVYASGGLLGLTAGYNMDMAGVVVGIEGDASWGNVHGERSSGDGDLSADLDSLLTLRGRLGFTRGNALMYGTAGIAAGHAHYTAFPWFSDNEAEESGYVAGLVGGAGVEFALTENLSLKTEGLVFQLSSLSAVTDDGKGGTFSSEYAPGGVSVRTGLNLSF